MSPAKVLFHPVAFLGILFSTTGAILPKAFHLDATWIWVIGLALALLPLATAQWNAFYGNTVVPVNLATFHMWIAMLTTLSAIIQTIQTALASAPASVLVPGVLIGVLAILYGVCNAAANQLHLDEGESAPAAH